MEFGDDVVRFNIFDALKHPDEEHVVFTLEILDILVQETLPYMFLKNFIDQTLEPKVVEFPELPEVANSLKLNQHSSIQLTPRL